MLALRQVLRNSGVYEFEHQLLCYIEWVYRDSLPTQLNMSTNPTAQTMSPAEYLALERAAIDAKHQYYNGRIYAMAGASTNHNRINTNLTIQIGNQIRERDCDVLASDMRVKIEATGLFTYPDLVVVCGEAKWDDDNFDTLLNPSLIIEILSPSTEKFDRKTKFNHYFQLPSLTDYLLVSQDQRLVEHFARHDEKTFIFQRAENNDTLSIESHNLRLPLSEIYHRVEENPDDQPTT